MRSLLNALNVIVLVAVVVTTSTSCLGENGPPVDLNALVNSYPDKGRLAIDPHVQPGMLGLTFDDGPSEFTQGIIDTLVRHRVEATFFMVGRLIPGRRDVLEYARNHGQQVASHSYNHEPQPSLTEDVFKQRVEAVKNNIGDNDGGRLYFRFPFGAAGDEQLRWLTDLDFDGKKYKAVGWHSDSQDFDFDGTYPADAFSKNILEDSVSCGDQANPFQHDFVGWCQFIARKTKGGVFLFHDTKRITHDKLEEILAGYESPERYFASLPADKRAEYIRYYECEEVDREMRFQFASLWGGAWPSLRD